MRIQGLYTALITPFDKNLKVDTIGLKKNIQFQIDSGCDGIVLLGTTGETPTLTHSEIEEIITLAVNEINGKVPLFIGTGTYSTEETLINTKQAKTLGASGALIVSPYYNKPTQEGIYLHFKTIAKSVDFPIIVYNIQGRTGQNIETSTLLRLSRIPQIVGVKEASGNILQMIEVISTVTKERPDFAVLSGDDNLALPLIALGGNGVISVVSNLIPNAMKELIETALAGDIVKARALHYKLLPIFKGAFLETNPVPIKTAMNSLGMPAGGVRLPLCDLMEENKNRLHHIIESLFKT